MYICSVAKTVAKTTVRNDRVLILLEQNVTLPVFGGFSHCDRTARLNSKRKTRKIHQQKITTLRHSKVLHEKKKTVDLYNIQITIRPFGRIIIIVIQSVVMVSRKFEKKKTERRQPWN